MMIPCVPVGLGAGATVGEGAPVVAGTDAFADEPKNAAAATTMGNASSIRRRVVEV